MKKIIMIVVALVLLGGGGFAAFTFFAGSSAEASLPDEKKSADAKKAEDAKKKSEQDAIVAFVKMDPLTLPVVNKDGIVQIINISVTLEVENPEKAKEIEKFTPRLKDAFIQDMYGALSTKTGMSEKGVIDVEVVKSRLHKITTKVLGEEGGVRDVLLQAIQQRKA